MENKLIFYLGVFFLIGIVILASLLIFEEFSQASPGPGCDCLCNYPGCPAVLSPPCAAPPACSWQNDACGDAPCAATERHQTCGPVGCSGNCDGQVPGSTRCIADPACAAPPSCVPGGGDGICPANCEGNPSDPDCVCQNDNNWCGIGCNNANDNDCPILINPLKFGSFEELIEGIINFIFWVAVALAPLMIIVGGFYFLTSGGDPERIRTAKNIILYACIGLLIILLARGIIFVIKQVIGG